MRRYTLAEQVYDTLLKRIASAQIRPGDALVVPRIARELDVSQTPVREAIEKLVVLGLARRQAHRRCTVALPAAEELAEIFEVRQALEGMAARIMAERGRNTDIAALRSRYDGLMEAASRRHFSDYCLQDYEFHAHIIRHCGNRHIADSGKAEALLLLSYFHLEPFNSNGIEPPWEGNITDDHIEMVKAIEARDIDAAERAVRAHLQRAREKVLTWVEQSRRKQQEAVAAGEEVAGDS